MEFHTTILKIPYCPDNIKRLLEERKQGRIYGEKCSKIILRVLIHTRLQFEEYSPTKKFEAGFLKFMTSYIKEKIVALHYISHKFIVFFELYLAPHSPSKLTPFYFSRAAFFITN